MQQPLKAKENQLTVGGKTLWNTLPNFVVWDKHEHTQFVIVFAIRKANAQQVAENMVGILTICTEPFAFAHHVNAGKTLNKHFNWINTLTLTLYALFVMRVGTRIKFPCKPVMLWSIVLCLLLLLLHMPSIESGLYFSPVVYFAYNFKFLYF